MDPGWTVMTSGSVTRMDVRLDQGFVWKEAALVWLGCDGGAGDGGALHVGGYSHQGCPRYWATPYTPFTLVMAAIPLEWALSTWSPLVRSLHCCAWTVDQ